MVFRKKAVEPADPSPSVDLSTIVRAASEQALTDCGNFRLSELLSLPDNLRFLRAFCVADGCFELALFVLDAQHACSAPVPSVCDTLARKTCRKWDRRGGPVEAAFASAGDGAPTERLGAAEATVLRQLRADVAQARAEHEFVHRALVQEDRDGAALAAELRRADSAISA